MKVAIYTIAKNEAKFIDRWLDCGRDADHQIIVDTGSTDGTAERADHHISVQPWRFDVARNAALALVPADVDVCISLDMDEILVPGWRKGLEEAWTPETTKLRYPYVWSWNHDHSPGLTYYRDHIHLRKGYIWKHPVHEVLWHPAEVQTFTDLVRVHHHADTAKPRSQYLPLLAMAVTEDPYDDRNAFYYGRELHFYGLHEQAVSELRRHLSLPRATWAPERAASWRFIGRSLWSLKRYGECLQAYKEAVREAPGEREGWVELAQWYRAFGQWAEVMDACRAALSITTRPATYICEDFAWGPWPQQMLDEAASRMSR